MTGAICSPLISIGAWPTPGNSTSRGRGLDWQAAAFVLFRAFDIAKPPPIRWFEARYHGGFGVMFDDLLAAGYTLLALAVIKRLLG